ncbi:ABC transporter ATP-binding protein [Orrella sp. 11846]|uniref:ABC transporter ATP-binding protein n=1 Tax=Orrella sp. 11846 TaxID=3409913 RepID=UPI003B58E191
MIVVRDVYKRYWTRHGMGPWVLKGINLTIPKESKVGLIGVNGAGKSTLLGLIGGIDHPNRGTIERNCRLSWPMGRGGLEPSLTGRQNAKFVCRVHGHDDPADIADRLAYIEDFAEIGPAFDRPIYTYSSGMRSRIQFGLSLAFDFDMYISDEVTAAGDAAFKKKAAQAFKAKTNHAGMIMVAHSDSTLRQFCESGVWMRDGQAYWYDDIEDALKDYKDSLPK